MTNEQDLLSEINAFLKETGMRPAAFGARAVRNGHLIKRLEGGKTINLATMRRVQSFIREQREQFSASQAGAAQ